jgi:hypothetical protein
MVVSKIILVPYNSQLLFCSLTAAFEVIALSAGVSNLPRPLCLTTRTCYKLEVAAA